jgi:hypothetical protein
MPKMSSGNATAPAVYSATPAGAAAATAAAKGSPTPLAKGAGSRSVMVPKA